MELQIKRPIIASKEFLSKCIRVLKVSRKPTIEEVKQVSKVSAIGIIAIGVIGFIIGVLYILIFT